MSQVPDRAIYDPVGATLAAPTAHRAAIRGLNRRLAATLNDHAADSIMFLRNVAEQAGISVPDNEYFQYFPWDGDSAEKARYHQLNA